MALGHEILANDLLNDGRLVRPYEEAVEMEETYYLIEPPEHAKTQAKSVFTEWVLDEMGSASQQ